MTTLRVTFFGCAAVLGVLTVGQAAGYRINITPSMPQGLWRVERVDTVRRGDAVVVCLPGAVAALGRQREYLAPGPCPDGSEPLLKPVVAVAGDVVSVAATGISVNGVPLLGTAQLGWDAAGRELVGIAPANYTVASGSVWLVSARVLNGWDSRYFGAVSVDDIQGRAVPVWVRP